MKNNENAFITSDLSLTATLSLYQPIESLDNSDPRKVYFTFKKTPELEKLIEMYWSGELKVSPLDYFRKLSEIKTRIYSRI
ncbi:DUF5659 domain-containing protein [Patescibacteria group bacterium]|nr:DUF5659 domain-containing protein [Patescibacteria group bacterium]